MKKKYSLRNCYLVGISYVIQRIKLVLTLIISSLILFSCNCAKPVATFSTSNITTTSAVISWGQPDPAPAGYAYYYSTSSTAPGNGITPSGTTTNLSATLSGLSTGTDYYWWVRSSCGGDNSDWSASNFFSTSACKAPSSQPKTLSLTATGSSINGTFVASSPAADRYLVVASTSATAPAPPTNGATYAIGNSLASGYVVVDNDANTTFSLAGLQSSTTYYFYIYAYNRSSCSGGPAYNVSNPLSGSKATTSTQPSYCTPASTNSSVYIKSIRSLGTLGDAVNASNEYSTGGYRNFATTTIATQIAGGGINIEIVLAGSNANCTDKPSNQFIKTWIDWNRDGDFADAGEEVYMSGTATLPVSTALDNVFGFVIPSGTFPGNYRMRIRTKSTCDETDLQSCSSLLTGETEDYTIAVVEDYPAKILNVTDGSACGPSSSVVLKATKTAAATGFKWYANATDATPLTSTTNGSWTTPVISQTTTFYVTAYEGIYESRTRTPVVATIYPSSNISITPSVPEVCGENVKLTLSGSGDTIKQTVLLQNFESGLGDWTVATPKNIKGGADTPWSVKVSPYRPETTTVWRPAVNSGAVGTVGNKFAFTTSDYSGSDIITELISPPVDVSSYDELTLTFDHYFSSYKDDKGELFIATNAAGTNWVSVMPAITSDNNSPSKFGAAPNINLTAYKNTTTLRFKFVYTATWDDGWAIDNIKLEGQKNLSTNFTWAGVSAGSLIDCNTGAAISGTTSNVCFKPLAADYETKASWTVTATAQLSTGCTVTGTITIPNNNRYWKNASQTNWASTLWQPNTAIPTANNCVFVNQPLVVGAFNQGLAKNITVRNAGKLTVLGSLKVTDAVINEAGTDNFIVESDASLIQVNEGNNINSGNITAKRTVNVSPGRQQYNYLISPLEGQSLKTVYRGIDYVLYHNEANNFFYNSTGAYIKGRALAVKEPKLSALPDQKATSVTATFTGYPTNGAFTYNLVNSNPANISRGYNLVGNPYPSNMDLVALYNLNGGKTGKLSSSFHLWDNLANSQTVQMGDQYKGQAYAIFNAVTPPDTGTGTRAAAGDYPLVGSKIPTQYVKMGQGFMVKAIQPTQLIFNNTVRTDKNGTAFFGKSADSAQTDRYWLNMVSPTNVISNIAVVYFDGGTATFSEDDSPSLGGSDELYSVVDSEKININGRSQFSAEDIVPLGTRHFTSGEYRIELAGKEGVFASIQPIYLKDKVTGIITNLSESHYTFEAEAGESTNRFEIAYKPGGVLATDNTVKESVVVYRDKNDFHVKSDHRKITGLQLFDSSGRLIFSSKPSSADAVIDGRALSEGVYILKIERGSEVLSRKILR